MVFYVKFVVVEQKERINDGDLGKYYFIMQIYYFNEQNRKIKDWDTKNIVKWYDIMIK